ncbi:MAG: alpha-amylase/4-alpha-glucanotransferase domain-containing protein [Chloroflexota bacterium]
MAPGISLALAIHNHQPVGNFGWVIEDVYEHAYEPLLGALERHPTVSMALHYSGPLLDWLRAEQPRFLARLSALARRGQVELLGGAYDEPILVAIPVQDRVGQLRQMSDAVEALGGTRPAGAWLAERVWEPSLPVDLTDGGYAWTILDDAHFRAAALPEDAIWGPRLTEDQGVPLTVFATEQGLRYRIPFRPVEEVIDHLRANATGDRSRLGVMGDDGEKFGGWPTTFEHCWGSGRWMERFFAALEANAAWLRTVTPSAWLATHPASGRAAIPTSSYVEMGEWALPPDESIPYSAILDEALESGDPLGRWLRGGFWRNFQVRYREVNDLHKQMLRVSRKVAAMRRGTARERATSHLYQGQSNDCYWHGLFGGIYISHMRLATHEHLIAAEDLADRSRSGRDARRSQVADLDLDGRPEVLLSAPGQVVSIDPAEGGGIGTWDIRAARHALTAVMRRRPEAGHARLRQAAAPGGVDRSAVTSIHELVSAKEPGLAAALRYDAYERRSGLVRLLPPAWTAESWADGSADPGDLVSAPFELVEVLADLVRMRGAGAIRTGRRRSQAVGAETELTLGGGRRRPTLRVRLSVDNRSGSRIDGRVGLEWNLTMLGGGGNPAAWYEVGAERCRHDRAGSAEGIHSIAQGNDWIGIALVTRVSEPADAWWFPIETISNSEAGFERVYQGSSLLLSWAIRLEPGERRSFEVDHALTVSRDRAIEEATGA